MKKRIILILIIAALIISAIGCARKDSSDNGKIMPPEQGDSEQSDVQNRPDKEPEPQQPSPPPVEPQPTPPPPEEYVYKNDHKGYSVTVPAGFTVDTAMSEVVTVLNSRDTAIEIYKQELKYLTEEEYLNYTNKFLENTVDHHLDIKQSYDLNGRQFHVVAWHRDPLRAVPNDKNYYISYDFIEDGVLWCIFVKTTDPTQDPSKYQGFIDSMEFYKPTAPEPLWTSKRTEKEWNRETTEFFNKYFGDDASLEWGLFEKTSVNGDTTLLNSHEQKIGYEFPVIVTYVGLQRKPSATIKDVLDYTWKEGKVLELSLQTLANEDGSNTMYDVLNGELDDVLKYYADVIREFSHPVLFRLMNEMNGDWCEYSAFHTSKDTDIYKAVYRYIYNFFKKEHVKNAIWVWNPNEGSFPDFAWNDELMYYPGDEYVDIVGLTAYNTGNYYKEHGERWQSFTTLYKELYDDYCSHYSQPFMITEFGCAEMGGDKRAWTRDMFDCIGDYDRIKVAVWWSHVDLDPENGNIARDYRIDGLIDIFKEKLKRP